MITTRALIGLLAPEYRISGKKRDLNLIISLYALGNNYFEKIKNIIRNLWKFQIYPSSLPDHGYRREGRSQIS
jgi:hypothetical protein